MTCTWPGGRTAARDAFGALGSAHLVASPGLDVAEAGRSRARRPNQREFSLGDGKERQRLRQGEAKSARWLSGPGLLGGRQVVNKAALAPEWRRRAAGAVAVEGSGPATPAGLEEPRPHPHLRRGAEHQTPGPPGVSGEMCWRGLPRAVAVPSPRVPAPDSSWRGWKLAPWRPELRPTWRRWYAGRAPPCACAPRRPLEYRKDNDIMDLSQDPLAS
ncbi:uncharacterized protein LOC122690461 [Cervus elaphus]|uniref:uncharacterized protein LOC122690461 n=1 Tax=Cervus elaphus TaxID=9860 RepID=UPI001CC2C8A4|nr:uncharacterized protein LOC122690461 [Cervus elaphus]